MGLASSSTVATHSSEIGGSNPANGKRENERKKFFEICLWSRISIKNLLSKYEGATTFSITTPSMTTFSVTIRKNDTQDNDFSVMTLNAYAECHYSECFYA